MELVVGLAIQDREYLAFLVAVFLVGLDSLVREFQVSQEVEFLVGLDFQGREYRVIRVQAFRDIQALVSADGLGFLGLAYQVSQALA